MTKPSPIADLDPSSANAFQRLLDVIANQGAPLNSRVRAATVCLRARSSIARPAVEKLLQESALTISQRVRLDSALVHARARRGRPRRG